MSTNPDQLDGDEDYWEIYTTYVDDKPAVILVDVGIANKIPLDGMPTLAWLWVHFNGPDEDGFPSEDEDMKLNEVEDLITDTLDASVHRYVGRITSDGRREFYFYSKNSEEFKAQITQAMTSFPSYQIELDEADDENWTHYTDVLSPSPEDQQQIQNQNQIYELEQNGDDLDTPRPIFHSLSFPTEQTRDDFVVAATSLGYSVVEKSETDSEMPFAVELTKIDPVDPETIDQVTYELFELSVNYDGIYGNWRADPAK